MRILPALLATILAAALVLGCRGASTPAEVADGVGEAEKSPSTSAAADTRSVQEPSSEKNAPAVIDAATRAALEVVANDAWYGVYMMGRKVGHARMWFRKTRGDEPGGYTTGLEVSMTVEGGGRRMTMKLGEDRYYAVEAPHLLVDTRFFSDASGVSDRRRAVRGGDGFVVSRTVNGVEQKTRTMAASKESLAALLATTPLSVDTLAAGARYQATMFDWQREADDDIDVEVVSVDRIKRAGVETRIATLSLTYARLGLTARSRIADRGVVLEMSMGATVQLKQEEEQVAKSGVTGLDIMASGVKAGRLLGDPSKVRALTLRATVPEGFVLPSAPNQRVTRGDDGRLTVVLRQGPGEAVTAEARALALADDAIIDWKSESIMARASQLTRQATTAVEKVRAIATWVHRALDKKLATHLPSASTILAKQVGDCTEHTWLFTALARSVGVPARPVYGLAYTGDLEGVFAYHAWVEVALDGHWVPIDPTWGEALADATHLKLGDELARVGLALGGLQLEVVDTPEAVDTP